MGKIRKMEPISLHFQNNDGDFERLSFTDEPSDRATRFLDKMRREDRVHINLGTRCDPWPNGIVLKNCRVKRKNRDGSYEIAWEETEEFDPEKHIWFEEEE